MATVHRQAGSPYYFAFFRIPDGKTRDGKIKWKLIKQSTKKTNKTEAGAVALKLEKAAADEAGASNTKEAKYLQILREATEDAINGVLNVRVATEHLNRITECATGKRLQSYTIETWLRSWISAKHSAQKSKGTMLRYSGVIEDFLKSLEPDRRSAPLGSLAIEEIIAFQKSGQSTGKSPVTVNLSIKTLSMALQRAVELGHLRINPTKGFDKLRTEVGSKDVFSVEQASVLIATAERDWKGAILFGFFTGLRLRDIANLQWCNVDLISRNVNFKVAKTQRRILIPLHDQLHEFLAPRKGEALTTSPVFPELFGKATSGRSGLSMSFARIMQKSKIEGTTIKGAGTKGRSKNTLSFHSLRHSFTSSLANAGVSADVRQKLTGHLDAKTHQNYTHPEIKMLNDAIGKLPRLA